MSVFLIALAHGMLLIVSFEAGIVREFQRKRLLQEPILVVNPVTPVNPAAQGEVVDAQNESSVAAQMVLCNPWWGLLATP